MIEITNVSKSYNGSTYAVKDLSLSVPSGEIFGFLGPNGAGKSTTIKMITGIHGVDKGTITINGKNIMEEPMEAKKTFGYVPDSPDMFLRLKGIEYLNFMADMYEVPKEVRQERIESLAKKFDLYNALSDQIQSYSHGMRQKIVIIGVLVAEKICYRVAINNKGNLQFKGNLDEMRDHFKSNESLEKMFLEMTGNE